MRATGIIYVKGAYEAVLQRCLWQRRGTEDQPLDRDRWLAQPGGRWRPWGSAPWPWP